MVDCGQLKVAASLLATVALASHSVAAEPSQDRYSLGTDSLTWAIDGYSLIGTWERASLPGLRWHVEAFGIEIPEGLIDGFEGNTGEGWRRRIDLALMLSADHHPFGLARFALGRRLQCPAHQRVAQRHRWRADLRPDRAHGARRLSGGFRSLMSGSS